MATAAVRLAPSILKRRLFWSEADALAPFALIWGVSATLLFGFVRKAQQNGDRSASEFASTHDKFWDAAAYKDIKAHHYKHLKRISLG